MRKKYEIKLTTKFKRQLKKIRKQSNFDYDSLDNVLNILSSNEKLPARYKNHLLEPKDERNMGMPCTTRCFIGI